MTTPDHTDYWEERAACHTVTPDLFFTDRPTLVAQAKSTCARCSVQGECLALALRSETLYPYRYGIFGGMTASERQTFVNGFRRT